MSHVAMNAQSPGLLAMNSTVRVRRLARVRWSPATGRPLETGPPSVLDHPQGVAVNMHRMVIHRGRDCQSECALGRQVLRAWGAAPGRPCAFRVSTLNSIISLGSGRFVPGTIFHSLSMKHVVPVGRRNLRLARMNNEHAKHSESHLGHLVVMRMIHEGAVLPDRELVLERLSRTRSAA